MLFVCYLQKIKPKYYFCFMAKILMRIGLEEVSIFGFVGYYDEEQLLGNNFLIDVYVDFYPDLFEDDISNTVNYEILHQFIKNAFSKPARLLETVASQIIQNILKTAPKSQFIEVSIRKKNPPMQGEIKNALVKLTYRQDEIQ